MIMMKMNVLMLLVLSCVCQTEKIKKDVEMVNEKLSYPINFPLLYNTVYSRPKDIQQEENTPSNEFVNINNKLLKPQLITTVHFTVDNVSHQTPNNSTYKIVKNITENDVENINEPNMLYSEIMKYFIEFRFL